MQVELGKGCLQSIIGTDGDCIGKAGSGLAEGAGDFELGFTRRIHLAAFFQGVEPDVIRVSRLQAAAVQEVLLQQADSLTAAEQGAVIAGEVADVVLPCLCQRGVCGIGSQDMAVEMRAPDILFLILRIGKQGARCIEPAFRQACGLDFFQTVVVDQKPGFLLPIGTGDLNTDIRAV